MIQIQTLSSMSHRILQQTCRCSLGSQVMVRKKCKRVVAGIRIELTSRWLDWVFQGIFFWAFESRNKEIFLTAFMSTV